MKLALAIVSFCAAVCAPAASAQKTSLVDVGVVVPSDVITGEQVSATLVTNPKDFAGIPGLRVVTAQIPAAASANPASLLSGYQVQIGQALHAGDRPFSFTSAANLALQLRARADCHR